MVGIAVRWFPEVTYDLDAPDNEEAPPGMQELGLGRYPTEGDIQELRRYLITARNSMENYN
jgi:hypothetical protein